VFIPPPGLTEADVLQAIERACEHIPRRLLFPGVTEDDLRQEARMYCIELLGKGKYDGRRPLANYLFTHVRRRLLNKKRNEYHRYDAPCATCYAGTPCSPGGFCPKFVAWKKRQDLRARIRQPQVLDWSPEPVREGDAERAVAGSQLREMIDAELPIEMRVTYLRMLAGVPVQTVDKRRVREKILEIIHGEPGLAEELGLPGHPDDAAVAAAA
jgi:hypothetical protein